VDQFPGNRQAPQSQNPYSYASNNPVNLVDPSGHYPSVSGVIWPSIGKLVEFAEWTMSKKGLINCDLILDDRQNASNDIAIDLFFDFICEYGPETREFDSDDHLTLELAESSVIHQMRQKFYREGGQLLSGDDWKFNAPQFGLATLDLIYANVKWFPVGVNVTHFLGSYNEYRVEKTEDGIEFVIENRTDRSSWTHIPLRFEPDYYMYLESVVEESPELSSANLISFVLTKPVISVLKPRGRSATSDFINPPEGGGNMWQIFSWTESSLCNEWRYPWPLVLRDLTIH
jgi:hypothetical protein